MTLKQLLAKKIGFISLGCDKNRVDLEKMIHRIKCAGFTIVNDSNLADVIIINTCSFIKDARVESINTILEMAQLKTDKLEKLIVTGCINNMKIVDLNESLPEVDSFVKVEKNKDIVEIICNLYGVKSIDYKTDLTFEQRILTTPNHYAYLKIADGCDNFCTYCTIPYIRGRYVSEKIESLLNEATFLVNSGVKELILVAQDLTRYGVDLYNEKSLVRLIRELSKIEKLEKIRLLYCYPDSIDDELIDEIKNNDKVCKYMDIPLQHVSNKILKFMNRRVDYDKIVDVITKLKSIPNMTIRSTFIIGFPHEDEDDFNILCDFIEKYKLDNVGFFKYSKEEGTPAYTMPQVPYKIKNQRLKEISSKQFINVTQRLQSKINSYTTAIVDDIYDDYAICRDDSSCPLVDGIIKVKLIPNIIIGNTYKIKITGYKKYDLEGEIYELT